MLADTLVRAYLKQIVIDGVFHADPHPGNVFVTDDGLLALIDLGMIGRLSPQMQERLLKLLLAVSEGRGEEAADVAVTLGEKLPDFNEAGFRRAIGGAGRPHRPSVDRRVPDRAGLPRAVAADPRQPHARAGRADHARQDAAQLDEVARALDPQLDVNEAVRRNGADLMTQRMRKAVTSGSVISTLLEAKEFAEKLPGRVNRVLDALAASELKMKVEVIDDGAIIDGLQKVANRITLGLILAAMIVASAMMMRIETDASASSAIPGFAMMLLRAGRSPARPISPFRSSATTAARHARDAPPSRILGATQGYGTSGRIAGAAAIVRAPDPRLTQPKGIATAWTRVRRLIWSWWPWAILCIYYIDQRNWWAALRHRALVRRLLAVDAGGVPAAVRPRSRPRRSARRNSSTPWPAPPACRSCRATRSTLLNNGDHFYPAMLQAIDAGRAIDHHRGLHLLGRRDRHHVRQGARRRGRSAASRSRSCSTRSARRASATRS